MEIWIQFYPLYWIEWCNDSGGMVVRTNVDQNSQVYETDFVQYFKVLSITVADPVGRTQGVPLRVTIPSFWPTKFTKRSHVGSCTPYEVGASLREILDPPLY